MRQRRWARCRPVGHGAVRCGPQQHHHDRAPRRTEPPLCPDADYWNQGNFTPVTTEETVTDLTVIGTMPKVLSGLFVRNGSNSQMGDSAHWFLGDGMIHGVRIEAGKAQWYRNRYVRTPFKESRKDTLSFGGAVMPLDGSGDDIRWIDVPLGYAFHGLNAHRDGDDVVIHLHRLDEAFGPKGNLLSPYLTEWRIGMGDTMTFSEQRVSDLSMDLPTLDRRFAGRQNRHGWCATTTSLDSEYGFELKGICHIDTKTGKEDVWDPGANRRSGEGFFVPTGKEEGDGFVLTYIWDRTTDRSSLGIFDAQAMAKGPVAEVQLPVRVPFGFHGLWVDEADL